MDESSYLFTRTSQTLREVLKGHESPDRHQRVKELARIYQPVFEATAKRALRRYGDANATLDAQDIVGDEILKMLSPASEYFRTYDTHKSVRAWIKACILHRVIDFLRRKGMKKGLDESVVSTESPSIIDEQEIFELFRVALRIADAICRLRGCQAEMAIFRAVKGFRDKLPVEERRKKGWTEGQERTAVYKVWRLIRDEAIPPAAAAVSNNPEEAQEIARWLWEQIRKWRTVSLPEESGDIHGKMDR